MSKVVYEICAIYSLNWLLLGSGHADTSSKVTVDRYTSYTPSRNNSHNCKYPPSFQEHPPALNDWLQMYPNKLLIFAFFSPHLQYTKILPNYQLSFYFCIFFQRIKPPIFLEHNQDWWFPYPLFILPVSGLMVILSVLHCAPSSAPFFKNQYESIWKYIRVPKSHRPVFMGFQGILWRYREIYETGSQITIPSFIMFLPFRNAFLHGFLPFYVF